MPELYHGVCSTFVGRPHTAAAREARDISGCIFEQLFGDNSLAKNFFGSSFFSSQDLAMISNNYESTTIIINGNEKITRKTVHTPSGVRTTEYREYLNETTPKQDSDSRLGIHSRGGFQ